MRTRADTSGPLSLEEFETLPEEDGYIVEVSRGILCTSPRRVTRTGGSWPSWPTG